LTPKFIVNFNSLERYMEFGIKVIPTDDVTIEYYRTTKKILKTNKKIKISLVR